MIPRRTPPLTASWLRKLRIVRPDDKIVEALATDERMANLWREAGGWPGAEYLAQIAYYYSREDTLSLLTAAPDARIELVRPQYALGLAAEEFALQLEVWPTQAAELWGEPTDGIASRIRAFAAAALDEAEVQRSIFDGIPRPDPRGRGVRSETAFRRALAYALTRLAEKVGALPVTRQDELITILTNVVFPGNTVDAETMRRDRQRRRLKLGDNSH